MQSDEINAPNRARVWIVDDSPLAIELARRALEPLHLVESFIDGPALLEHLATHPAPDAVVLDWQMPGITGIEVCQFLRSGAATANLPILMLTANQKTRDVVEGLAAGADAFLTKPYNPAELSARIGALIRAKRTYEQLERAERTVRTLLRHLPEAVLTFTREGLVTFANDEAERLLGQREREMLGTHVAELLPEIPWRLIVENRQHDFFALPDLPRKGRILATMVRVFATPHLADAALTFRDVTKERQLAESRLDLYGVVAHDLRAPLSAIITRAEILLQGRRGPLSAEVAAEMTLLKQRMVDLDTMVGEFLGLARLESAELDVVRTSLDLGALLGEVVQDFLPQAESKGVTLTLSLEAPGEPPLVGGDKRLLRQVVSNLLSNAIKFSPAGGVVTVRCARAGEDIEVSVRDHGPGIEVAAIPKLFTRAARAPEPERATLSGTGLGLLIVKQLVEAHGGRVKVLSEEANGCTFSFSLPSLDRVSGPVGVPGITVKDARTILIVDDDDDLRGIISVLLMEQGYYVLQAENGRVALDMLLRMPRKPDLVFLDIAMPEMTGTQLLERLSSEKLLPALPVVVLSAHAVEINTARRILRKPVPIELLLQVAEEFTREMPPVAA